MKTYKFHNYSQKVTVTLQAESYKLASEMVSYGFRLFSITK
jgi:hypothetical protein